jgi:acetyl esterase/lipase
MLRTLLPRLILMATMSAIPSQLPAAVPVGEPEGETVILWPRGAPGGDAVTAREVLSERAPQGPLRDRIAQHVTRPLLTMFRPMAKANGVTLLLVPGGGYERVVIDKEGFESARWFAERGFECAVLRYRMPADGWQAGADAPVHDVMRAVRQLRVAKTGSTLDRRVGVIGFSAGGHIVARLITDSARFYAREDAIDELPSRPDFAVLMYPVIATTGPMAHAGSVRQLLLSGIGVADLDRYAPHLRVNASVPPTMLVHAADDESVPQENSTLMFDALQAARVRSELHVFDLGGHGFGMRGISGKSVAAWPQLVQNWALSN